MNAITLPELDPDLEAWLSQRATIHSVSMAEEVTAILRMALEREAPAWQLRFPPPVKLPPGAPSSTDLIREDRDSR
jgi:plasmid stability protein